MNTPADKTNNFDETLMTDLRELHNKLLVGQFYGETVVRWEGGRPVHVTVSQGMKPKDVSRLVLIQVV